MKKTTAKFCCEKYLYTFVPLKQYSIMQNRSNSFFYSFYYFYFKSDTGLYVV